MKLFVEGGGNNNHALGTECRRAFSTLLEAAGLKGRMPRIVACGGRQEAFNQFCNEVGRTQFALLLVDAEESVKHASPWDHVAKRVGDGWAKPAVADDDHLHLMVQCMESWILADRGSLARFFGQGFNENALPSQTATIEQVSKADLYSKLEAATKPAKSKSPYDKGTHSFKLLACVNPDSLRKACPSADRFFATLDRLMK